MRIRTLIGTLGFLATAAFATYATTASAEDEFSVSVSGNSVTVTAHSPWHINQEFEWKVKHDGHRLEAVHFTLSEGSASASGLPAGHHTLKGAVCNTSGDHKACMPFSKDIDIQ
jgi:hypothetical protein